MRKKWGMILGLTGMMLLGSQSIYAAEAADGTAETTDAANEKETAGTDDIDYVLIMTINPGTPGQTFIEKSLEKIANLKKMIGSRPIQIEVDGGVNDVIAKQVAGAGAELIVVGGYLFGGNPGERYSILREAVK